jgi:hypothetical protein
MNTMIKTLEEIGQSTSIKEFDSASDLLKQVNLSENIIDELRNNTHEYVCALVPDDDDDQETKISH